MTSPYSSGMQFLSPCKHWVPPQGPWFLFPPLGAILFFKKFLPLGHLLPPPLSFGVNMDWTLNDEIVCWEALWDLISSTSPLFLKSCVLLPPPSLEALTARWTSLRTPSPLPSVVVVSLLFRRSSLLGTNRRCPLLRTASQFSFTTAPFFFTYPHRRSLFPPPESSPKRM